MQNKKSVQNKKYVRDKKYVREKNIHSKRVAKLKDVLKEKKLQAFLTVSMENVFYLTGFTGSDGVFYVDDEHVILFTDSRYELQCKKEVKDAEVVIYKKKKEAFDSIDNMKGSIIGFNSNKVTHYFYRVLKKLLKGKKLKDCGGVVEGLRQIKDIHEINIIKKGITRARKSFKEVLQDLKEGVSELYLKNKLESLIRTNGCEKESFDTIVVSGRNSALIHGRPTSKKIKKGEFILIDYGVRYDNYCTDETYTVMLGEPDKKQRKIYDIVKKAQSLAISKIKDGISSKYIDNAAREYIKKSGYGNNFMHGLGHGIGIEVHEAPALTRCEDYVLKEGMVITIEPGIYIEDFGGIRIEDMVYITKTGCEKLTRGKKRLNI
jgi:Xaa-Pro aminopeptidase